MRTMTVPSAAMRRLRREFDSRRRIAVPPTGGVAKKLSVSPQSCSRWTSPAVDDDARLERARTPPRPPQAPSGSRNLRHGAATTPAAGAVLKNSSRPPARCSTQASHVPRRATGEVARLKHARTTPCSSRATFASISRHDAAAPPAGAALEKSSGPSAPPQPSSAASEFIKRGAQVHVRTTVGNLPTGQRLVLWLSAVVVSPAEDGYLRVVYNNGKFFPPGDPYRTVSVATDQVKKMPSDAASDTSTGSSTVTTTATSLQPYPETEVHHGH